MNYLNKIFFVRLLLALFTILLIGCKQKTILKKETIYRDSVIIRDTVLKINPEIFYIRDTIRETNFIREYIDKGGNKITIIKKDSLIYVKCNPAEIETILKKYFIKSETQTKTVETKTDDKKYLFYSVLICLFVFCLILVIKK
jgi:hypothetical protein